MKTNKTTSHCEQCIAVFETPEGDKAQGQICPECMTKGPLYVITCGDDDDDPRFFAGLQAGAEWLDESWYGEWHEFSQDEYVGALREDWEKLPVLDHSSLEALQRTLAEMMAFMQGFWSRHRHILEARDKHLARMSGSFRWLEIPTFEVPRITEVL